MGHIGIISPPVPGHLNPFMALGRALQSNGHRVTIFNISDLERTVRAEGLGFFALGVTDHPPGDLAENIRQISRRKGLAALRYAVGAIQRTTRIFCRDGPDAVRGSAIDFLLVDQTEPAGAAIAEHLKLPFVTVCNALAINRELSIPPPFTPWNYSSGLFTEARNWLGYSVWRTVTRPVTRVVDDFRERWGLPRYGRPEDSFSKLAQISQQPPAFDYPRRKLPKHFFYLGPFRFPSPNPVAFPWERLDGRPVIYASLGTLQNRTASLFHRIARACCGLDAQLVISTGGGLSDSEIAALPGSPLVVPYAPQPELLARARLTITHAGLNTVLDSLSCGVPMVAVPLAFEQPAIAARIEWTGAGVVVPYKRATPEALRTAVQQALCSKALEDGARRIAESIRTAGGVKRAVEIIEAAIDGRPILS